MVAQARRAVAAALSAAASMTGVIIYTRPCTTAAAAPPDSRPVVLFTDKWDRFIPRVAAQLNSDWHLVGSLEDVDPESVKVVVGGGPAVLEIVRKLPNVQLLQQPW